MDNIKNAFNDASILLNSIIKNDEILGKISKASKEISKCFKNKAKVFSCGNGGSCCDAMHFAEELTGRFRKDRPPFAAVAISDPGYITCVANDFGFENVFSRYITAHGQKGDTLLAISTSGKSINVINAALEAKKIGIKVISLTGKNNSELGKLSDIDLCVHHDGFADRVQEVHIKIIHILIELIEKEMFKKN